MTNGKTNSQYMERDFIDFTLMGGIPRLTRWFQGKNASEATVLAREFAEKLYVALINTLPNQTVQGRKEG